MRPLSCRFVRIDALPPAHPQAPGWSVPRRGFHTNTPLLIKPRLAHGLFDQATGTMAPERAEQPIAWLAAGKCLALRLPDDELIATLTPDDTVIDFGIGIGLSVPALLERGVRLIGIDRDRATVDLLSQHWGSNPRAERARFIEASALSQALHDVAEAHYVRCENVVPYLDDLALGALLGDVEQLLVPGGRCFISFYHPVQQDDWGIKRSVTDLVDRVPHGLMPLLRGVAFEAHDRAEQTMDVSSWSGSLLTGSPLRMVASQRSHTATLVDAEIRAFARLLEEDGASHIGVRVAIVLEKPRFA